MGGVAPRVEAGLCLNFPAALGLPTRSSPPPLPSPSPRIQTAATVEYHGLDSADPVDGDVYVARRTGHACWYADGAAERELSTAVLQWITRRF